MTLKSQIPAIKSKVLQNILNASDLTQNYVDVITDHLDGIKPDMQENLLKQLNDFEPVSAEEAGAKATLTFILQDMKRERNMIEDIRKILDMSCEPFNARKTMIKALAEDIVEQANIDTHYVHGEFKHAMDNPDYMDPETAKIIRACLTLPW